MGAIRKKRIRTPTVIQMEATECGAACLAIVLGYFGRIVPLEEARYECGVSRDGSKAGNIVKAAQRYGLLAAGYRKEPQQLRDLPLPQILHWDFKHFVVLEGIKKDKAYINDPAFGPRVVDWATLDRCFTGITIAFEKGPAFEPGGQKRSIAAALARRLKGSWTALTYAVLAGLVLAIPGIVGPAFSKVFLDEVFVGGRARWAVPLLVAMGATAAVEAVLFYLQKTHLLKLGVRLSVRESARFFRRVLSLPAEFFNQRYGGEIGSRVEINERVSRIVSDSLSANVIGALMLFAYSALMWMYSAPLTILGLLVAGLNILVIHLLARLRKDWSMRMINRRSRIAGVSMGALQSVETLKASGRESDFFSAWAGQQAELLSSQQELSRLTLVLDKVPFLLTSFNGAAMLAIGGLEIMTGELSIGGFMIFQTLMPLLFQPFQQLASMMGSIQELEGDMNRLDDVFSYDPDPVCRPVEALPSPSCAFSVKLTGRLEIRDLTFGYSRLSAPLIRGFSLTVEPGSRVAIVGGSGSGKSTLARLAVGLYQPWSGTVLYDGMPIEKIARSAFSNSVAMVDQELFLFEGTVRENITLWDRAIPFEDVVAAARDAAIHDVLSARPGGYESLVAEAGANFSGGQRQRLEIARALVNNPVMLVLDEATSALDPTTEKTIDDNLRRRGCACLIVAHRLSTIRDCDEIVVLENGEIVQRGTHEEMMEEADGPYAALMRAEG